MDEFLFFDPRALPVILPTLANGAALVLTSSIAPNAADDLMRLFDAKYSDGTRVVTVLNWIEACPACTKANRADRCTHVVRRPQHFQKGTDQVRPCLLVGTNHCSHPYVQDRLRALLGVFGGGHWEREMLNVADEPTRKPAFKFEDLQFLRSPLAVYRDEYACKRFITCIDPNAGSLSSDFAMISFAVIRLGDVDYTVVRILFFYWAFYTLHGAARNIHTYTAEARMPLNRIAMHLRQRGRGPRASAPNGKMRRVALRTSWQTPGRVRASADRTQRTARHRT